MKPEQRVDRILQLVLEQPPAERESYIHEVCGNDEQLRREVLISLESHQQSPAPAAAAKPPRENPNYVPDLKEGDFVGPYRIVRVLGYGGMGDVYLAEHMGLSRDNWNSEQAFSFAWARDGKHVAVARGSRNDDIVLIRDSNSSK